MVTAHTTTSNPNHKPNQQNNHTDNPIEDVVHKRFHTTTNKQKTKLDNVPAT